MGGGAPLVRLSVTPPPPPGVTNRQVLLLGCSLVFLVGGQASKTPRLGHRGGGVTLSPSGDSHLGCACACVVRVCVYTRVSINTPRVPPEAAECLWSILEAG
jgi:hypothetical protein